MLNVRVVFSAVAIGFAHGAVAGPIVFHQSFDPTGGDYASQNDITPEVGYGNFATVYDNFRLSTAQPITDVHWVGAYFNPPAQGPITRFTVSFWGDAGNQPGALLRSEVFAGTAGETFLTSANGFPTYTYSVDLTSPFQAAANTTYWLSIVPDLAFPPQWGWATGTGGDARAWQVFFGAGTALLTDMAFDLTSKSVPEPGPVALLALACGAFGVTQTTVRGRTSKGA